jgi:hypothetical protein
VSGVDAESGIGREVYAELCDRYGHEDFEVLQIPIGSPECFMYPDEYLAIECEDMSPVVFADGAKVSAGVSDAVSIVGSINI